MSTHQSDSIPAPRRGRLAFDRADWFATRALVALAAVVALGAAIVAPLVRWTQGRPVELAVDGPISVPLLDTAGVGYGPGSYRARIEDPSVGQRLLEWAPGAILAVVAVAVAVLVSRVLRSIVRGEAFTAATVRRLRLVAIVVVTAAVAWPFVAGLAQLALRTSLDVEGLGPEVPVDISWLSLIGGLVIAAIAEAFNQARALREDLEGLV